MNDITIHIKNMVCTRCIRVVNEELKKAGFTVMHIELGKAILHDRNPDKAILARLFQLNGFELLEEKVAKIVNELKIYIIQYFREGHAEDQKLKLSL